MKKLIILFSLCMCVCPVYAKSDWLHPHLVRAAYAATQKAPYMAIIQFAWEKPVRSSEVMFRPPRGRNVVLRWDHDITTCWGVVSDEGRVYFMSDCLEPGSFKIQHLKRVQITFANGVNAEGSASSIGRYEGVAWILVQRAALQGLTQVPVRHTPKNQSLQAAYGETMTQKLKQFFQSKHIPARSRSCRIGAVQRKPRMQVGDPVLIEGKLTAFVKTVPSSYLNGWGNVSERAFAVIY